MATRAGNQIQVPCKNSKCSSEPSRQPLDQDFDDNVRSLGIVGFLRPTDCGEHSAGPVESCCVAFPGEM